MKKILVISCIMILLLVSCTNMQQDRSSQGAANSGNDNKEDTDNVQTPVELTVVSTFAGNDGNAINYAESYHRWEEETGHRVIDRSAGSDQSFKAKVVADFATNSEPDVLFFFTGVDANSFIEAGKVVSIEEIRQEYPDYANNMLSSQIPPSPVDGKQYTVPVNGYWEAMFVNTEILEEAGIELPGAEYTWEEFLADCETVKEAGYIPVSVALGHIPHYWWESAVFNHTGPGQHLTIPDTVDSKIGQDWVAGLNDIKGLYEAGYFPGNTLSITDEEAFSLFMEGKAAFLLDGSWKVNGIVAACRRDASDPSSVDREKLSKFDIIYVPGTRERKASDMIGGISMGYYITRKAWEDPLKREAAVSFVSHMTSNEIVGLFSQYTTSALLDSGGTEREEDIELQSKAMEMLANSTSLTDAVQDLFYSDFRMTLFEAVPDIVTGNREARDVVEEALCMEW